MTDSSSVSPRSREERLRDIGKRLHEARQAQNISIQEIAGRLNFSVKQTKALESGDWSSLPDDVYGLGFLRQYALYLGIDINDDIRDLKTSVSLTQAVTIPDPAIAPTRSWAWLALLLFVLLAVYYNVQDLEDGGMPSSIVPPNDGMPTAIVPPAPQADTTVATSEPSLPSPTMKASPSPATNQPAVATPEEPATNEETIPATAASNDANENQKPPSTNDQASTASHEVRFTASGGDVWLRINGVADDGNTAVKLKEILLHDGQNITLDTERKQLIVTAGNALNLAITVDGIVAHAKGTLGKDGKVVRNMPLILSTAD